MINHEDMKAAREIGQLVISPAGLFWRDPQRGPVRVWGFTGTDKIAMEYKEEPPTPQSRLQMQEHE